jgi:dihydrofolate reductase
VKGRDEGGGRRSGRQLRKALKKCEGKGKRIFILGGKELLPHYANVAAETAGAVTVSFVSPFCSRRV